ERDREAGVAQAPERGEERLDLGRREDRGRLVQDQDAHRADERAHHLDPLLLADRQLLDPPVGADLEPEPRRGFLEEPARARAAASEGGGPARARWARTPPRRQRMGFSPMVRLGTSVKGGGTIRTPASAASRGDAGGSGRPPRSTVPESGRRSPAATPISV